MHVIAHHGIRADIDGKDRLQFEYPRSDPVTAMREILSGLRVLSAKKLPPDTAGDAVVSGGRIQRNLIFPRLWHAKSAFTIGMRVRDRFLHYNQKTPRILVGIFLRYGCPGSGSIWVSGIRVHIGVSSSLVAGSNLSVLPDARQ